jgi:hypothetical protein
MTPGETALHPDLAAAETQLGISLTNLRVAAQTTGQAIEVVRRDVKNSLQEALRKQASESSGLDIYAFGSIGRHEMGDQSDFDYLVVVNSINVTPSKIKMYRQAAVKAHMALGVDPPGDSGLFGGAISAPHLVNVIGLNEDSNLNMSQRVLLLQESIALNPRDEREKVMSAILARYLLDYEGRAEQPLVPRFLLNDVVRFWRTVAVDYQAKRWHELAGVKWGLRYIKLRSSRKWSFAGNVMALFLPSIAGQPTTVEALMAQFNKPPLARLAQLTEYSESGGQTRAALREVLCLADWFVGQLNRDVWREAVAGEEDPAAGRDNPLFVEAQEQTLRLQQALEALFFSDESLGESGQSLGGLSKKYLSF